MAEPMYSSTGFPLIWHVILRQISLFGTFKILNVNKVRISTINRTNMTPIYWIVHWPTPSIIAENVIKIKYILIGTNLYSSIPTRSWTSTY